MHWCNLSDVNEAIKTKPNQTKQENPTTNKENYFIWVLIYQLSQSKWAYRSLPESTETGTGKWSPPQSSSASIALSYPPDRANHRDVLPKSAVGQSHSSSSDNYWHNDDHVKETERRIWRHIKTIFVWLVMISSNRLQIKYVVVYWVFRICPWQLLQECLAQIDMIIYFCSFLQKNKPLQESCVCIWEIIYKIKIAW